MKSTNLKILKENGINVPEFIIVKNEGEVTPPLLFTLSSDIKYAVRSSFEGEDGNNNSFAGQFDTFLNVEKGDIKDAVKKVRTSFENKNIADYSKAKDIKNSFTGEIIIQKMVNAEYSGVIFTANPLGILNETVVVVGKGLGNNIVEDKVNITTYYYNQDDDVYYYEQQEDTPLLKKEVLKQLIDISKKIKDIFDFDADIEFAIENDEVFILQTRPITTLNKDNVIILDNSNIVESYPGISLPLTQDFVKCIYYEIFRNCLRRITKNKSLVADLDKNLQDMVDIANWRIYYRISNWYSVLKLLPMSNKIISIWQEMLGVSNTYVSTPDMKKVPVRTKLSILHSVIHYLNKTPKLMDDLNSRFETKYKKYNQMVDNSHTVNELLSLYTTIRNDFLSNWDLTLINDMYTFIYTGLAGKKNREFISNIKNLESMKPVISINNLVEMGKIYGYESNIYRDFFYDYIKKYGDRCLNELKLETKTYRTHPQLLQEYVEKRISSESIQIKNDSVEKEKKKIFIKRARMGIKNRETSRLNRSRMFGLTRKIFRNIGDILVRDGWIDNVDDVFYLYIEELQGKETELRSIIRNRKDEEKMYEKIPAYSRLVFSDKIINKKCISAINNVFENKDKLDGIPSSTGKVVGEVLVIDEPNDSIDTKGKILVTKSTDPAWVFLIQNAVGIIAEKGSLLSHTAIISRELHKPAVVNVKDCTKILKNGDTVELDAENGIIKILRRCENGKL